jgi:hypothetical protein
MPDEWSIGDWDGRWVDRSVMPTRDPAEVATSSERFRAAGGAIGSATAVPTGRFESCDDGAVAEVWELRPFHI